MVVIVTLITLLQLFYVFLGALYFVLTDDKMPPFRPLRVITVIPAHNEERVIARSVSSAVVQTDEVWVIADRCTDNTAAIARRFGAQVLERQEGPGGKQFALAWAFPRLPDCDAVLVLDADNVLCPGAVLRAVALLHKYDVVQMRVDALAPRSLHAKWYGLVGAFWHCWQAGRMICRRYAVLCGTGMLLRRDLLRHVPWDARSLCDDWEYTYKLRKAGRTIGYAPSAVTLDEKPESWTVGLRQRLRWARGSWQLLGQAIQTINTDPELALWGILPIIYGLLVCFRFRSVLSPIALLSALWLVPAAVAVGHPEWWSGALIGWWGCWSSALLCIIAALTYRNTSWFRTPHG